MRVSLKRCLWVCGLLLGFQGALSAQESGDALFGDVALKVNGEPVYLVEYANAYRQAMKNSFYHGSVPEAELKTFNQKVMDNQINLVLAEKEAYSRGLEFDAAWVDKNVTELDAANQKSEKWAQVRGQWLPRVRLSYERQSLLERLEKHVRESVTATDDAVLEFYQQKPESFTQPPRQRVSLLLIKVDPSAGSEGWSKVSEEVSALRKSLDDGADFSELAEELSNDPSAENGGDMGYLHQGMLGTDAQLVLDELEINEISQPVVLLDGVALFRLTDRIPANLQAFDVVRERAKGLYLRERGELEWQALLFRLRQSADIEVDQELLATVIHK